MAGDISTGSSTTSRLPIWQDAASAGWLSYLWLAGGAVVSLFALNGRWDLPIAGWLVSVALLRFCRSRGVGVGVGGVLLVYAIDGLFYTLTSGLDIASALRMSTLTVGIGLVLTLPFLADHLLAPRIRGASALLATLIFPLGRVVAEFLVATASPAGDIYGSLAGTQLDDLPLMQFASITGSYGVSFLVAWLASVANTVWEERRRTRLVGTVAAVYVCVLALVIIGGSIRMAADAPGQSTVRVAAVTPTRGLLDAAAKISPTGTNANGTDQGLGPVTRPLPREYTQVNDDLLASTEREARAGAKIIVWSEAAAAVRQADRDTFFKQVGDLARRHGVYVEVGVIVFTDKAPYAENQAVLVDPAGQSLWNFEKAHPVPGMDMTVPGKPVVPTADTPYGRLGNVICFDADFPALLRQGGAKDVSLMLVPASDWRGFGTPHARLASMRAIENGYSLVRPDQFGSTRMFDYQGRVLGAGDYYLSNQQSVLANVSTQGVHTIYGTIGDAFAWLCVAAFVALGSYGAILQARRGRRRRRPVS